jgi:hypothetical protein
MLSRFARASAAAASRSVAPTQLSGRAAFSLSRPSHIIGIDLGTTNSCVAVMEVRSRGSDAFMIVIRENCRLGKTTGQEPPRHRELRGCANDAVHCRLPSRRQSPRGYSSEASSSHEPTGHNHCVQASHRPQIRRPRRAEDHQDGALGRILGQLVIAQRSLRATQRRPFCRTRTRSSRLTTATHGSKRRARRSAPPRSALSCS